MELMPCDIVLVKGYGRGIISDVICDIENSQYSHSAILINGNIIIEAGMFNVRYNLLDNYKGYFDIYRCLDINNLQRKSIIDYLILQLGKQYDYKLLIWEYIRLKLNIILPYFNSSSVICSELVRDSFLNSTNIDLTPVIRFPTPKDLSESKILTQIGG